MVYRVCLFILIFVAASIFRLSNLDLIEFKLDEARDVYEMAKFHQEPYLFQRGTIQSTGVYNPPLWYYFLGLISLPSIDPEYLSFMIALLNCLAIAGFYWVVQKFYGQLTGIIAGLLLAFSPWAIIMSRKIWAPDMILVLVVPILYFLHQLDKAKSWFWLVLLLSLLAQLHASGLFLSLAVVISLIRRIRQISLIELKLGFLGLAVSLIPLLPYIWFQLQTGCEDCQTFFAYQGEGKSFSTAVFLRPFQWINGGSFEILLGDDYSNFVDHSSFIKPITFIFLFEYLLSIWGVIALVKLKKISLLMILAIIPVAYFLTQTLPIMHYFVIVLPIMILVYGLGISTIKKIGLIGQISLISLILIINAVFMLEFYQFLDQKQTINGDYGTIFKLTNQANPETLELKRAYYFVSKLKP